MPLILPPPNVAHGPWRSAGPVTPSAPKGSGWLETVWDVLTGTFEVIDFDLIDLVFGFVRVVAHCALVMLRVIF